MTRCLAILRNQTLRVRHGQLVLGLWWNDNFCRYWYIGGTK